jgi:hypothetical protein
MKFDLSVLLYYQCLVIFKDNLPVDTGNLRHNATRLTLLKPGAYYGIDESEADYTEAVFNYYLTYRNQNFMYNAVVRMYEFLLYTVYGGNTLVNQNYLNARRNVLATSKDNERRQVRNVLHGSGDYADKTLKEKILNNFE